MFECLLARRTLGAVFLSGGLPICPLRLRDTTADVSNYQKENIRMMCLGMGKDKPQPNGERHEGRLFGLAPRVQSIPKPQKDRVGH